MWQWMHSTRPVESRGFRRTARFPRLIACGLSCSCLLACSVNTFAAETVAPPSLDISRYWKFSTGDDPSGAQATFDDSRWESIEVGKPWEQQGHAEYNGVAWYRLQVHVPAEWQQHEFLKRHPFLMLDLGRIDDVDKTWWNGRPVGQTGEGPDNYSTRWSIERHYRVPLDEVKWGTENVIAVQVYDGANEGGMYQGPYALRVPAWYDFVELKIDFGDQSGVFDDPAGLPLSVILSNQVSEIIEGTLTWEVETDEGLVVATHSVEAFLTGNSSQRFHWNLAAAQPGFYRVRCSLTNSSFPGEAVFTKTLGYRPEAIHSPTTRQEDFEQFWFNTLEELKQVDPEFKLTPHSDRDTATHEVFEVQMRSLGGVRVAGWYERPKAPGPHPALLRVPGYTSSMLPSQTDGPIAIFSFNIRAHGNSQQDVKGQPEDYWTRGLDDKDTYFYRGAYCDCVRAVDFLVSRKEVDPSRVAVTGDSQGGGLSLVTAGLDTRIALCMPNISFLCDWQRYFKTSDWPEMEKWIAARNDRSWSSTLKTMSYFDALNFADQIDCPVLLGLGLQDDVCPPASIFSVYNRIPGKKDYRVYPNAVHWVEASHQRLQQQWLKQFLISLSPQSH